MSVLERQSPPRYIRLRAWMVEHSLTCTALGKLIGCSNPYTYRLLSGDFIPRKRHEQLLTIGIPIDLLPKPKDTKLGRKKVSTSAPAWMQKNIGKQQKAHASA